MQQQNFNHQINKTNILIVGSGAIGLLWYSKFYLLNQPKVQCYLYQSPTREPLKSELEFTDLNQLNNRIATQIFSDSDNLKNKTPFDIILICVKSYQVNQAIIDIKHLIKPTTLLIKTHNGLGALNHQLSEDLKDNLVLDLLTTHGCLKNSNSQFTHTGSGVSHLGTKLGNINTTFQNHTTELLNSVLPEVIWCDDIEIKQWTKLAINCVINPLTALFDIKNGDITRPEFDKTIEQIINEVVQVANEKGVVLNKEELKATVLLVANNTANNSSSMRCDIQQNRQTEIDYINGYIHRIGQEYNLPTPKNTELYQKIMAL